MNKIFFLFLIYFLKVVFIVAQTTNLNGYNSFYYENKKMSSEGFLKNGKPNGYWKNYFENGKIKIEGNRKNFLLDSIWKFYNEKGKIIKIINYKLGKKNGATLTYDSIQKIISKELYVNDLKEGISKTYYPTGKIKTSAMFINNKQEGAAYTFTNDSLITSITLYKGGILQSYEKINQTDYKNKKQGVWKEFYPNTTIKKEMSFNDDSLDGYVKEYTKEGNLIGTKKFNNGKQLMHAPEIANVEIYRDKYADGTLKYEGVYVDGVAIGTHYKYKRKKQCDSTTYLRDDTSNVYLNRLVCRYEAIPDSAIEYFEDTIIAIGKVDKERNRIGVWIEYFNTGEFKAKGTYKNGRRVGAWEFFYTTGKLEQKGKYNESGKEQGPWNWYYENGKLMREENYINGNREGKLIDYNEDGKITSQGVYKTNKKEGFWEYESTEYKEIGNYVNDEPDSLWKSYFMPSKIKRFEGVFSEGSPVGFHVMYHRNGKRLSAGNYKAGMKEGDWKYYDEEEFNYLTIQYKNNIEIKWQGKKIMPSSEEGIKTYNLIMEGNRTQTKKIK